MNSTKIKQNTQIKLKNPIKFNNFIFDYINTVIIEQIKLN